ncbi:class I SAM-dependent methyltransferase [Klenkia sp. LSe6-5]|uniref:Class I SAM-dependent methyltransferase n=1 Tax=Klenkia sesuvii TaxID=3103137 RepID=A0ABU8DZ25_9ACTN
MTGRPTGFGSTPAEDWTSSDTEQVSCCQCGVPGRPLYEVAPLGVVRCPVCGLVFTSPRLRPEALRRLYDDAGYFAGRVYDAEVPGEGPGSRHSPTMVLQRTWTAGRLRLLDRLREQPAGGRLLEVGAGYGLFLAAAREAGWTTSGVELSRSGAQYATEVLGLDVFCGQLADAPLRPGLDVVCAWDTLEHVPDPLGFLRSVRSSLAEDGVLLFSTPYVSSVPARLLGPRWWTLKPAEHLWHFTPRDLAQLAARAGLVLTQVVRNPLARANAARLDSLVGVARPVPDR